MWSALFLDVFFCYMFFLFYQIIVDVFAQRLFEVQVILYLTHELPIHIFARFHLLGFLSFSC